MLVLLLIIAASVVPGFFLALCGLLSIWLVFGRTHLAIRVPVFLLATLPLGVTLSLIEARSGGVASFIGFTAFAVLSAVIVERYLIVTLVTSALCFLMGVPATLEQYSRGNLDPSWLATTALALCCLAGFIWILRLFGFRLVCFATDEISQDIYLATGRDVNEWITILDEHGAASWTYADIVIFLREFGFTYHWQKAITIVYEKSLGRRTVDRASDGKAHPIAFDTPWDPTQWIRRLTEHRFTIEQMLLWSVAAACFFGFFRVFSRFEVTSDHIFVGVPVVLAMSVVSVLLLHECLAVRNRLPKLVTVLLAVVGMCAILPTWVALFPGILEVYLLMLSSMLGFAAWLAVGLLLVRQKGYRLVRLHRSAQSVYATGV